jgi:hypothetical protein
MGYLIRNNKKKIIIISFIIILVIGINVLLKQWDRYKYNTGYNLTNTEKSNNIRTAILGKQYDNALKLTNDYYEDNDTIRLQWKNKIEKCKKEGINKFMLEDSLDDIK